MASLHVAVIGGGIVGACCAMELTRVGHRVTLIEPDEPGGPQAASSGNGAWLSPASVVPMAMPGIWRRVPGFLGDPLGPLAIRPGALPALAPWLARFVLAGATVARVERTARALRPLLERSPERHAALARDAGVPDLIRQDGLLYAYPSRDAFAGDALAWRLRRDNGIAWTELDGPALRERVPALARRYGFGALVEAGGHCADPGGYVGALVRHLVSRGMEVRRAAATGFDIRDRRLAAVTTTAGSLCCERAVIAAGVWSRGLARAAGDRVSLASERGYHVVLADPEAAPAIPVMPWDGKMANTPTRHGLRASGQVELARPGDPPDWRRARILLDHLLTTYDGLPGHIPDTRLSTWMGHRPSTPDGLPVIGLASGCRDVVHAFGHGHVGLASAPATGEAVARLIGGETPDLAAYGPRRFRLLPRWAISGSRGLS